MADRGRPTSRSGGSRSGGERKRRSAPRRPRRARREGHVARLRRGLGAGKVADAAKAIGLSTTRRAALAATVVCALAFALAVPLRTYLSQNADVAEQQQRQQQLREQVAYLEQQRAELSDPAQVEAAARRRLGYVMPGETPYVVQLPADGAHGGAGRKPGPDERRTWYEDLWNDVAEK